MKSDDEQKYDRFSLFSGKPKSSVRKSWETVNRLIPKEYRQTHQDFHVYYEALGDKPGCDFRYTSFAKNKKSGIYEKITSFVQPHSEKGDGVDSGAVFSKSSVSLLTDLLDKLLASRLIQNQFVQNNFAKLLSLYPGSYEMAYYDTDSALYDLNTHNPDYLYELAQKLPADQSVFDKIYNKNRNDIVGHDGLIELEKKKGTLRFYIFSDEAQQEMLKNKNHVLYFADESDYKIKDILEKTDKALLHDADVAMRFMILGAKEFKLVPALKNSPEFMLKVAKNQWLFGKSKSNGKGNGKNNKLINGNNGKPKNEYLYNDPLTREDFHEFFPHFQQYPEVAIALKKTLGETLISQNELDIRYEEVIPEVYRHHNENSNNHHSTLVVNWKKSNMVTWRFQTFVKDALLNAYILIHEGKVKDGYPAYYQDSRFRDLDVNYPDVFLNTHHRDYLMKLPEEGKVCLNEMLDKFAPEFENLMNDKEFLLTQKIGMDDVKYLSDTMRSDADVAIHAVNSLDGYHIYNQVSLSDFEALKNNRDVVVAFCQQDVKNFSYASSELRKDKDFVMDLIEKTFSKEKRDTNKTANVKHSTVYQYADESVKENPEVAMFAIQYSQALDSVPDSAKTQELQVEALNVNLHNYYDTTKSFRDNPENENWGIEAFEADRKVYPLLPDSLKAREDMAYFALINRVSLEHFPHKFQDDWDVALLALKLKQDNYQYMSERLRDDETLLIIATTCFWELEEDEPYAQLLKETGEQAKLMMYDVTFTDSRHIQYASNRLQQRFGTNDPYAYVKKEEHALDLAQRLEAQYGSGSDEDEDKDDNSIWNSDMDNENNDSHHRPMKI